MKSKNWRKVNETVDGALALTIWRRRRFAENFCLENPDLRSEIESLLDVENETEGFFEVLAVFSYSLFLCN